MPWETFNFMRVAPATTRMKPAWARVSVFDTAPCFAGLNDFAQPDG
jgi:hypothetical protein